MDHAVLMRIVQRAGDCHRDPHSLIDGELTFAVEAFAQAFPFDKGHDIEQQPVRLSAVEQREEVRMLEIRCDLDLRKEALDAQHGPQLGAQHLECDAALVPNVARKIHGRHAAAADLTIDAVTARQRCVEVKDCFQHGSL